jgi:hypothetical protein
MMHKESIHKYRISRRLAIQTASRNVWGKSHSAIPSFGALMVDNVVVIIFDLPQQWLRVMNVSGWSGVSTSLIY